MNVILDANVVISAVLAPESSQSPVVQVLSLAADRRIVLLIPKETLEELETILSSKPWLVRRVSPSVRAAFLRRLRRSATVLPALTEAPSGRCRDRRDDYLLEHALVAAAEVLVTGDDDLLDLSPPPAGLRTLTPRDFVEWWDGLGNSANS